MDAHNKATSIDSTHFNKFYIDGSWVDPSASGSIEVISPNTEEVVFRVAEAAEADVDRAVSAARKAFDQGPWPRLSAAERAQHIRALAEQIRGRIPDLETAFIEQMGALASMAKGVTPYAIGALDRYADMATSFEFVRKRPTLSGAGVGYLVYEPAGVVAAITPWNVPLITMLNKIAPAIAAGCTVIMKPAPETPIEAYIIAECADAAGIPKGVLNLLTAGREVSDYLVRKPEVDKVSFTGSLAAGQRIASVCGERIGRVTLELGGKSAAIIRDDYDLETAAASLAPAVCGLAGQNCAALTRVVVSRDRHDELVGLLADKMKAIKIGHSYDPDAQMGPLAMKRQLERVESYIQKGKDEGADLVVGGNRPSHLNNGYFIEPTLFANVDNSMAIAQDEIFGPVMCVIPCDNDDDAIQIANDSNYGLAGAVYTNDVDAAYRIARNVRTGTMGHNGPKADFTIGFGGFKQSGVGREGGEAGLMSYLEAKTVLMEEEPSELRAP